ncbi:MAG TPA: hypothetical protein VK638_49425 [Edaphobacter sp.]|nr:hypothetical protein [Edaphobacter sp.]
MASRTVVNPYSARCLQQQVTYPLPVLGGRRPSLAANADERGVFRSPSLRACSARNAAPKSMKVDRRAGRSVQNRAATRPPSTNAVLLAKTTDGSAYTGLT